MKTRQIQVFKSVSVHLGLRIAQCFLSIINFGTGKLEVTTRVTEGARRERHKLKQRDLLGLLPSFLRLSASPLGARAHVHFPH